MTNHRGKFTIIWPDGIEVEVTGTLTEAPSGSLQSWGGTAATSDVSASARPSGDVRIRFPDGSEAEAHVTNVSADISQRGASVTVSLAGRGDPPS